MWLHDGLTQSPSEAVQLGLWEGPEASLADGQLVTLIEEGVQNSLCLFTGAPYYLHTGKEVNLEKVPRWAG